jgi:TonB family protein
MFSKNFHRAGGRLPLYAALALSLLLHAAILSADQLQALWQRHPPAGGALPKVSVKLVRLTPEPPQAVPPKPVPAVKSTAKSPPRPAPKSGVTEAQIAAPKTSEPPEPPAPPVPEPQAKDEPVEVADVAPQTLIGTSVPDYPKEVLRLGLQGCVLYALDVDRSGGVERVEIMQSDHPGIFDEAIIAAQQQGRYFPAFKGGRPVKSRIFGVASFEIEGSAPLNCAVRFVDKVRGRALVLRE